MGKADGVYPSKKKKKRFPRVLDAELANTQLPPYFFCTTVCVVGWVFTPVKKKKKKKNILCRTFNIWGMSISPGVGLYPKLYSTSLEKCRRRTG